MKKTDTSSYSFADSFWAIVGVLILLIAGASILWRQYNEVNDLLLSKQWPSTLGRVETSELFWTESVGEYDLSEKVARISYSYSVGSQVQEGKVSTDATIFTSRVNRFSAKYPEGSQITVYFYPDNPYRSIVEPGLNINLFKMLISLIFIFGVFSALWNQVKKWFLVFETQRINIAA